MLTVEEVHAARARRASINHETYKAILAKVQAAVRSAAPITTQITYRIPQFVTGRPMYDVSHAVRYVRDKLARGGFGVTVDGAALTIDWSQAAAAAVSRRRLAPPPSAAPARPSRSSGGSGGSGGGPSGSGSDSFVGLPMNISSKLASLKKKLEF